MSKRFIITKYFFNSLIFIFLCLTIFVAFTSKLSLFGFKSYIVLSGSMEPALPIGSIVLIHPSSAYTLGDIIAFTNKSRLTTTHRIVAVSSSSFKVAGDANDSPDADLVSSGQIIGKAVFHLPLLGYLANSLHTPLGFILFLGLPTLIFITAELWHIKLEIEQITERKVLSRLHLDHP